jgi:NitT/TauT family transport system permease protein
MRANETADAGTVATSHQTPEPSAVQANSGPITEKLNRTWWQRNGRTSLVWSLRVGLLVAVLGIWQIAADRWIDPTFISKPSLIIEQLVQWMINGTIWVHSWITIQEVVYGFLLGAFAGAIIGFILASLNLMYQVFEPFMLALYSIPKVALAPLFIIWFGIGMNMKVFLAAATVFFLVFLNTAAAVREVDRGLIDAVRLMGGSRRQIAAKVLLPASMTGVLVGLKVGIPYALIGAVIGELVASNRGLGYLINDSASQFNTAGVFAALVALSIIATVLNFGVSALSKRINRWKPSDENP